VLLQKLPRIQYEAGRQLPRLASHHREGNRCRERLRAATGRPSRTGGGCTPDIRYFPARRRNAVNFSPALTVVRTEFEPASWDAFQRTSLRGERPAEVALVNLSINGRHRPLSVLQRLRQLLDGLLD